MIRRRVAGVRAGVGIAVAIAVAAGCAETTVDTDPSTSDAPAVTVTPVTTPAGTGTATVADLGAALVAEARLLSDTIVEGDGEGEALARLQAIWTELRPQVEASDPELLDGFDAAMGLAENGVRRRRPADADKAANNLATLVGAL